MVTANLIAEKHRYKATQILEFITIGAGQTTSSVLDCFGVQLRKLLFPSNWTNCNLSFLTSPGQNVDGSFTTFLDTNFDGSPLLISTTANQSLPIIPGYFDSTKYFQLQCDVPQSQTVTIIALFQPLFQGIHG